MITRTSTVVPRTPPMESRGKSCHTGVKFDPKSLGVSDDPVLTRTFRGHKSRVVAVAFNPNMKQIASASHDRTVMLWNFRPQLRAYKFTGHKGPIYDLTFSDCGRILASASKDCTVRLWTPDVRGDSHVLKAHTKGVRSVCISKDSSLLLTASDDKTVKMWSTHQRKFKCSFTGHKHWVRSAHLSPDCSLAVSGSDDKTVRLWDTSTGRCKSVLRDHDEPITSVRFHPDGSSFASAGADKCINIWDSRSATLLQHYAGHDACISRICFHPSGNFLMSSSHDQVLKIWDLREGHLLYTLKAHAGPVNGVDFSPDGNYFASGGDDNMVMVWRWFHLTRQPGVLSACKQQAKQEAAQPSRHRGSDAHVTPQKVQAIPRPSAAVVASSTTPNTETDSHKLAPSPTPSTTPMRPRRPRVVEAALLQHNSPHPTPMPTTLTTSKSTTVTTPKPATVTSTMATPKSASPGGTTPPESFATAQVTSFALAATAPARGPGADAPTLPLPTTSFLPAKSSLAASSADGSKLDAREEQFRAQMTTSIAAILAQLQTMNAKVEALDQRLSRTEDRTSQLFDAFVNGPSHQS